MTLKLSVCPNKVKDLKKVWTLTWPFGIFILSPLSMREVLCYQLFVAILLIHWYYIDIKLNYFSSRATVELEN